MGWKGAPWLLDYSHLRLRRNSAPDEFDAQRRQSIPFGGRGDAHEEKDLQPDQIEAFFPYGTVQLPIDCHPLLALDPAANIQMLFAPAYAAVNVIGRFRVRSMPNGVTLAAAALIEH